MSAKHPGITTAAGEAIAALEALAVEDRPLKERLIDAWTSHLSKLHGVELPREFQKRFNALTLDLPREELIADAIEALTPDDARMLARRMVHFTLDLEMTIGAQRS